MILLAAISLCLIILVIHRPAEAEEPDKSIIYKTVGEHELQLHIFNPEDHGPNASTPAIVFFFGGGWSGGSPSQFYPHCEYLSGRGMVAISAEYRVKTRQTRLYVALDATFLIPKDFYKIYIPANQTAQSITELIRYLNTLDYDDWRLNTAPPTELNHT